MSDTPVGGILYEKLARMRPKVHIQFSSASSSISVIVMSRYTSPRARVRPPRQEPSTTYAIYKGRATTTWTSVLLGVSHFSSVDEGGTRSGEDLEWGPGRGAMVNWVMSFARRSS